MARPGPTPHSGSISPSPLLSSSSFNSSSCFHHHHHQQRACARDLEREQVDVRLALLARTLLFGPRSTRRRPTCLCPMLDARDDRTPIARIPYGGADAETNHWSDFSRDNNGAAAAIITPVVTRAPRASLDGVSPLSSAAGSGRNSPSGAGLRSRRTAQSQGHKRSATLDDGSLVASASACAAAAHPLQSGSPSRMGLSRSAEEGVTRPALKRMLSDNGLWPDDENSGATGTREQELTRNGTKSRAGEGEMLVIIHQVSHTDSLAGVALKYGISLADLRKVNQLWASDSIHLRKRLYIPLYLTDGKRLPIPIDQTEQDAVTNGDDDTSDPFDQDQSHDSKTTTTTIKRVPISQLKFFPPSSQPLHVSPKSSRAVSNGDASYSPSTSTQTLTSFISALPLPSKQSILARLSIDSSETSSATGASETSSDQEHELEELGQRTGRDHDRDDGRTPTSHHHNFSLSPSPYRKRAVHAALRSKQITESETIALISDFDASFNEAVPLPPLQTEQLKPSPQMELPRIPRSGRD